MRGRLFATPTLSLSPAPTLALTAIPLETATLSLTSTPPKTPTLAPTETPFILYRKNLINVTYCTMDNLPQRLDLYMPDEGGPWPVVVFLHGGGWRDGDKAALEAKNIAQLINPLGYVVASLNYRLYPDARFPAMIEDAKCGVRFLRANAVKYNLDPTRFLAWGVSAGGHLAALLGTTDQSAGWDVGEYLDQSSRVQAVIDVSGPSDLTLGFSTAGLRQASLFAFGIARSLRVIGSPVNYVTSDDAPFLLLNGDKDPAVPIAQGEAMYDALIKAGVPAKLVIVKNGVHNLTAYDANPTAPTQDEIRQILLDFLIEKLNNKQ
jgi:acetyl esterase/lipase